MFLGLGGVSTAGAGARGAVEAAKTLKGLAPGQVTLTGEKIPATRGFPFTLGQSLFIIGLILQVATAAIDRYEKVRLIAEARSQQKLRADLIRELKGSEDFKRAVSLRNQRARSAMP